MNSHKVKNAPPSGTGFQVCECGATRRVEAGVIMGDWHVCKLCVITPCTEVTP